jgi:hypothetical protein
MLHTDVVNKYTPSFRRRSSVKYETESKFNANSVGRGKIPRGQRNCGVGLTTHLHHLVLKVGMGGVKILHHPYAFLTYKGNILLFVFYFSPTYLTVSKPVMNSRAIFRYMCHNIIGHILPQHCI